MAFSCDDVPECSFPEPHADLVGIDVGIAHFSTDTEGLHIANPKYYRKAQEELRRKQRKVSRRKKGSNRRRKAVKELARTHRRYQICAMTFFIKQRTTT